MATSLLDMEFTPPPRTVKDEGDRWRGKTDSGGNERWRTGGENDNERWPRRDSDRRDSPGNDRKSRERERSPRDRRPRDRDNRRGAVRNDRMVYVANIPYDVRWMELKDLVREKAGEVNFVELLEDRNGKSKGAAVIEFREKESVQRCVEALHRYPLKDRLLTAKEIRDPVAFFRKVKDDTGVDFLNGLHGGTAAAPDRGRYDDKFETYGLSPAFLRQLHIAGPLSSRVFVSNLPYNVQSGRIYEYFSLAGKVSMVDLHLDKEGRSKGMAVVQFTHPIEAVQAISMLNNQRIFERQINVKMDKFEPVDDRKEGELPVGLRGVGMGLGANGAPLGDVTSVISSLNASGPQGAFENSSASYGNANTPFQAGALPSLQPSSLSSVLNFSSNYPNSNPVPLSATSQHYPPSGYSNYSIGSRSIIIKNLPIDYTWQIVRDRVQQFGPVDLTEMIAPGCAKVTFAASSDAERARKALQNTTVEGRLIGVEFLV